MPTSNSTDVIVIGAGPVGENIADRIVKGGLEAIIVEAELVGGECSYWACMPSKTLIRPTTVLQAVRHVPGAAEAVTGDLDVGAVLARRNWMTSDWSDKGQVAWLDSAGIRLVRGKGRIAAVRTVQVTTPEGEVEEWTARYAVVIATGSVPQIPDIPGIADVDAWSTREATSAQSIPGRFVVIGGGVAGTELAQAYARLGSQVTMLVRRELLSGFPRPAVDLVAEALAADRVDLRLNTTPIFVRKNDSGETEIELESGETITCDAVCVSTGRRPALDDIGLNSIGFDENRIEVGDDGRVSGVKDGWLYAVGDAAGKVLLTHQGKYEARLTGDVIVARSRSESVDAGERWSRYTSSANHVAVPSVVFTDPELAMVGRSQMQAEKDGLRVRVIERAVDVAAASIHADDYAGWAQMVVDEDRRVIVGMTFAGQDVSELLHAATIAIVGEIPLSRLWHAVPAYPTLSEIWLRLLEDYGL